MLGRNPPNGRTPLGKSMRDKILRPLVIDRARQGALRKPVLVLTLTDGAASMFHLITQTYTKGT